MSHLSELENRLSIRPIGDLYDSTISTENVYYIKFPYYSSLEDIPNIDTIISDLNSFIERVNDNATIAIFLSQLTNKAFFRLWIGVKLKNPYSITKKQLPQHHAALAVIKR